MNCDEFLQRLHQRLDHRKSIDDDHELCQHASRCESCGAQLAAWRQIASVIPRTAPAPTPGTGGRSRIGKAVSVIAGLAAAILLVVIFAPRGWQSDPPVAAKSDSPTETALASSGSQLDPTIWWQSVQDRDWVGQTMPTVKSVQEGVAPIGRSLMRAVTILTIGGRDQTS